ncbi:transcription factor IIIC subunit delta N-term-domain-containing protein [Aspergillus crustosus]
MLEPLQLQLFPSCYNCISWSDDGEIAVALDEYVQILTPKTPSKGQANDASAQVSTVDWHRTRFRANVFTNNEWPILFPQPRDQFSIGAEQSMSSVVGVAWSAPGLVKHRRSVLAVLTSNMVLSIYALVPNTGKWTRIAIVNKALESYFAEGAESTPRARKSSIRAFTWTPPLKIPAENQLYPGPDSRWGISFLAVTNDENDVVFLQVQEPSAPQASPEPFRIEAVSVVPLPSSTGFDRFLQPTSIFASALRFQTRILSLGSGPWLFEGQESVAIGSEPVFATVNIAAVQGTNLRLVNLRVGMETPVDDAGNELRYSFNFAATENTEVSAAEVGDVQCNGPICWVQEVDSGKVSLAVGAVAGLVTIDIPEHTYKGRASEDSQNYAHFSPLLTESVDASESGRLGHQERISGMAIATDPGTKTPILHFGTVGGYSATQPLGASAITDGPSHAPWSDRIDDIRERFDIDRDLGGLAISRVWGVASAQGLVAAAVTLHPGDMVEYRTNAEDRLTLVFSTASGMLLNTEEVPLLSGAPLNSTDYIRERRDVVLRYILRNEDEVGAKRTLSPKVSYAAACCAIVQSNDAELLSRARNVLENLAETSGVNLSDEIEKCSALGLGSTIDAKPADILEAPGGSILEKCEVCETGIVWYSAGEAQCAAGHLFGRSQYVRVKMISLITLTVRCSLTFIAIQEPGVSKFCSRCESEYFDEDLVSQSLHSDIQQDCKILSDVFDICIYCGGKFRP